VRFHDPPEASQPEARASGGERSIVDALVSPIQSGIQSLAGVAGGALDPLLNGVFGGILSGSGDYTVEMEPPVMANSIIHPTLADSTPAFGAEDGHVMLSHREYLQDITVLANQAERFIYFTINPGDVLTFPWLNRIAICFEQYRLLGCVFEFRSTSTASTTNANPALWNVAMATQYNVNSRVFGSKRQVLNHFFSTSGVASSDVLHPLECREEFTAVHPKYVRHQDIDPNLVSDARMLDVGRFCIHLSGGNVQAVVQTFGELHVTYQIALLKPRLPLLPQGTTYDAPDDALPDPEAQILHLPELQTLCCGEIDELRARIHAIEEEEKKEEDPPPSL